MSKPHPYVHHPRQFLEHEGSVFFTTVNGWLTSLLGSNIVFLLCFFVPLVAVPASNTVKLIVGIIFSNWFQAWALPVLQKGQAQADLKRSAKADADHETFTYMAQQIDRLNTQVTAIRTDLASK